MILLVSLLISLITLLTPCVVSSTTPSTMVKNNVITSNIVENASLSDGLNTLYFNNHEHYLGLAEATNIAISSTHLYYATATSLYSYSLQNKTLNKILDCSNIEDISYSHNQLFVFKNNKLYKIISNALIEYQTCDMYSIYTENDTTYLSMVSGNTFTTIRIDSLSEVKLWEDTIPISYTPIAIANSNTTAYIVAEQNSSTMILEKNFQQKSTIAFTYEFSNITNLYYWKEADSTILTFYTGDNLRTIKRQSDSESYIDVYTKVLYGHGNTDLKLENSTQ